MQTPIKERRRLVSQWRRAQPQTMSDFARAIGVPKSTFWRWTRELPEHAPDVAASPTFIELTAADLESIETSEAPTQALSIRLQGPANAEAQLHFDTPPSPVRLAEMLRGVLAC